MARRRERGSALVVAVAVVMVLSAVAVGLVRLGTSETAGAMAGARQQQLARCAEAARGLLMTKFHALGLPPADIVTLNVPLDGANGAVRAIGGHFDNQGVQVVRIEGTALGETSIKGDITNSVQTLGTGGSALKVVVHCQDHGTQGDPASGRQLEVELGVKFGL